jgi:short-subunit dehydrogenase
MRETRSIWIPAAVGVGAALAIRALVRRNRHYDLRGKVALITGASRGLGLVLAREFASRGCRVAICARDSAELERGCIDLKSRGAEVLAVTCDVVDPSQVEALARTVRERFGRIDVLVNNAGVIQVGPQDEMTVGDYEKAMQTHFWGPLFTTLAVLPEMRQRKAGRIVNISSIGGKVSIPHLVPYDASKFALVGLSEGLRAELARDHVYVTTVCPGLMRTGSHHNADFKGQHRAEFTWFSVGGALPLLSTSAEHAARQIVRACANGDAELVLTLPAKLAVAFHGLFPGLSADLLGLINRFLPEPVGTGTARTKGKDSHSSLSPSWLTRLSDQAAVRNNELPSGQEASVLPAHPV